MIEIMAWLMAIIALPGLCELLLLTFGVFLPSRERGASLHSGHLKIVIPAYNESVHLIPTLESLKACIDPYHRTTVIVIADNCSDDTADLAKQQQVRVIERKDALLVGKGHALRTTFEMLLEEKCDFVAVVDADTIVEKNFVWELRRAFATGAEAVQVPYRVHNVEDSMHTRLISLAFCTFNVLRPLAREKLHLSSGLLGNGFALTRTLLIEVPYAASSIVEDLEYHHQLVEAGHCVRFVPQTCVKARMPAFGPGKETQRLRWEGGRLRMIREKVPTLMRSVVRGKWRLAEPLFELLLPPLGYFALILMVGAILSNGLLFFYFLGGLLLLMLHVLVGWKVGGGTRHELLAILSLPLYLAQKVIRLCKVIPASCAAYSWKRTERQ